MAFLFAEIGFIGYNNEKTCLLWREKMVDKSMNHRVNMLYRQLGKSIYQEKRFLESLTKEQQKIVKEIEKTIIKLELQNELQKELQKELVNALPKDAKIIEPVKNEDGLFIYQFCSKCKVGNNPESTHCSHCFEPL